MSSPPLAAQRERRSNAGNRMRALLDVEFEAEEMFAEEEGDIEFVGDQVEEEDVFESDFASTEEEQDEDEDTQEKAILREEKAHRAAVRKKVERTTTTSLFTKKPPAKPVEPRPKLPKHVSIALPPEAALPGDNVKGLPFRRRQSSRASAQTAKLNLERKLKEDAARRASLMHKPKRPTVPRKTQDQLIADALELEERNVQSLKDFLAREEEKKRVARVVRKTVHEGGVLSFVSRAEEIKVPLVQVIEPGTTHLWEAHTLAVTNSAQNETEDLAQGSKPAEDTRPILESVSPAQRMSIADESEAKQSGEQERVSVGVAIEASPQATAATNGTIDVQHEDATANSTEAPQAEVGEANQQELSLGVPAAAIPQEEIHPVPFGGPEGVPNTDTSLPATGPSAPAQSQGPLTEDMHLQMRNLIALKDLIPQELISDDEGESDTQAKSKAKVPWTWVEEMGALFGDHVDWGNLRVVPARNRPIYRRPPMCPMTGLPAPYRDPSTGIPYANAKAYRVLRRLTQHEYAWGDGRGVYFGDEKEEGAKGVPEAWNSFVRGVMPRQKIPDTRKEEDVEMNDAAAVI
ncbi:YL1-domain-containing protein [Dacryopinax primogenitus]|uniref:YL1-domain-containing protein n=1 Tax=Dacryopinax primogenitus (strain DJM 731) TaxID=1858805 RepID=M5FU30_DACPD|nr:YL1-domain-containing protein [Dacryopinax primogenitus]EJT98999.1 YL1-domain-containing protein [Dacryopinax primogenitus]